MATLCLASAAALRADTVTCTDGRAMTCIILGESERAVRISLYGQEVEISRSAISSIGRASGEENAALEEEWRSLRGRFSEESPAPKRRTPAPTRAADETAPARTPSLRATAPTPLPRRTPAGPRPAPHPAADKRRQEILWRGEVRKAIAEKRVIPGMTAREVHSAWGWPERTHPVHGIDGSTDRWTYRREAEGLVDLYFKNGILTHLSR